MAEKPAPAAPSKVAVLHPPLLAVYRVLLLYAANMGLTPASALVRPILVLSLGAIALWLALWAILRHKYKAGLVASILIMSSMTGWYILQDFGIGKILPNLSDFPSEGFYVFYAAAIATTLVLIARWLKHRRRLAMILMIVSLVAAVAAFVSANIFLAPVYGGRTAWVLMVYACVVMGAIAYVIVSTNEFVTLTQTANWFAIILVAISVAVIVKPSSTSPVSEPEQLPKLATPAGDPTDRPDIYFILLDGYARSDVLQKKVNYDNEYWLLKELKSEGFVVYDKSLANYSLPIASLASCLNMDYVHELLPGGSVDTVEAANAAVEPTGKEPTADKATEKPTDGEPAPKTISEPTDGETTPNTATEPVGKQPAPDATADEAAVTSITIDLSELLNFYNNNRLYRFLAAQGYEITAFSPGLELFKPRANVDRVLSFDQKLSEFESWLIETSALSSVLQVTDYVRYGFAYYSSHQTQRRRVQFAADRLGVLAGDKGSRPKFVYAFLLVPQPPFLFDREGQWPERTNMALEGESAARLPNLMKQAYYDQLYYVNRLLLEMVSTILRNNANSIIVIASPRGRDLNFQLDADSDTVSRASLLNLIMIRLPEGYPSLPEPNGVMDMANLFRVTLNSAFNTKLELLNEGKPMAFITSSRGRRVTFTSVDVDSLLPEVLNDPSEEEDATDSPK